MVVPSATISGADAAPADRGVASGAFLWAYLPVCCRSLAGLTGGLIGTKRVSLLPEAGVFDVRKIASKRNINISDSIGRAPWVSSDP
jgi:hypothetical protein